MGNRFVVFHIKYDKVFKVPLLNNQKSVVKDGEKHKTS